MKTYLFYDIETSGLDHAFDQVLTFACIRTDLELNEIDRQTITIRLRKDIVPSPRAFLTHGLTYDELLLGISEYEAALRIHKILNTPNTISLGYNSLGFDDEFLRFMFYRNLLDPYIHQYGNGCSRMDILPITVVFRVFHPECLKWPQVDGKPSLRLDLITQENKFITSGKAHEAMSDVEAVIELSKVFFKKKDIWEYSLDFFNKLSDEVRISSIAEEFVVQNKRFSICLMVASSFGSKSNYLVPVVHLGQSIPYKNQSLWLRLDSEDILGIDANANLVDTFVIRKRAGDALIVLPTLERFWDKLPKEIQQLARDNMAKIRCHGDAFFKFIQYHCEYKHPFIPNMDPDAALYQDGFFSFQEKKQCELIHKILSNLKQGHKNQNILEDIKSPRLKILLSRIIARNFDDLSEKKSGIEDSLYMEKLRSSLEEDQIIGYKQNVKFNCKQGLQELKEIDKTLFNIEQLKMLEWLKVYIENL